MTTGEAWVADFDTHRFYTDKDAAIAALKAADDCESVLYEVRPIIVATRGPLRVRSLPKAKP